MFSNLLSENHDIYEITWTNVIDPERPEIKYNTTHAHCMLDK